MTSEFRHEYEARLGTWLLKRFLWWAGVIMGVNVLLVLSKGFSLFNSAGQGRADEIAKPIVAIVFILPVLVLYAGAFLRVRVKRYTREDVLRIVFMLIVVGGLVSLISKAMQLEVGNALITGGDSQNQSFVVRGALISIFFAHFSACLFLPWKWTESLRPILPLMVASAILTIIYGWGEWTSVIMTIVLSPLIAVPGVLIAAARTDRFRSRFRLMVLRRHYGEIKGELTDAQRIHEALLPKPIVDGPVRFEYRYQPMRQIGGDHIFVRLNGAGDELVMNMVLIDVTGHGISAALTVNRLHGELERQFGEKPDVAPAAVMVGLNDYLHYSLAQHSVYATAMAMRIDVKARRVTWSSAGHPPAFLRTVSGHIDRLESTTIVLGACRGEDFNAIEESMPMGPGDALIAYTDGATEARDIEGRMLRVEGIQSLLASGHPEVEGGWCAMILEAVDRFRDGPPQDDTLVVEAHCPMQ